MDTPQVRLYRFPHPWSQTLAEGALLQILQTAAVTMAEDLRTMIEAGEVEEGRDSFAVVVMNPVERRKDLLFKERVLASATVGPNGAKYLPNAAAKADAHDRAGIPNGVLVDQANFCLGDDDFAWGYSAEYRVEAPSDADDEVMVYAVAVAGGSGLSAEQDRAMAKKFLVTVMDQIHERRGSWIAERRREGSHGWYNRANEPGPEYAEIADFDSVSPTW